MGRDVAEVKVEGVMFLAGHPRPIQVVGTDGKRYSLALDDHARIERSRGF